MNSSRIRMVQTISRVGTAVRIKCLPKGKVKELKLLQEKLALATSKEREEWLKNCIMELVYPHVLHEQREHSNNDLYYGNKDVDDAK